MRKFKRICVYCGSSNKPAPVYFEAARAVGRMLAERHIAVVYGGGSTGLMGAVADGALEASGQVYGVIPDKLRALELGHGKLTELFVVDSMHARKMVMAQLSDGFMALPGGFGTLEEIFEVTTWTQLNYHKKPVGLLNVEGYFDGLLAFLDHARGSGFIRPEHASLLSAAATPEALLDALANAEIPELAKWIDNP